MAGSKVEAGTRIPTDWQFTPEWMTAVIARKHPGARVSGVHRLSGSDGTSSRALLGLDYAEGAGPGTLFAKTQGDIWHRLLHVMTGNLYREALLFSSGVDIPIEHPTPYHGHVDRLRLNELVIMEDLAPRHVTLNDATRPLSIDDVARGLRGLARFHSAFWKFSSAAYPALAWAKPWKATWTFRLILRGTCGAGIANMQEAVPPEVAAMGPKGIEKWWTRYIRTLSRGPMTLLHGDAHVGNTYLVPDGDLGFLDWACVRVGNWSFDVGYFLVGALDVGERRAHEADLIEEYRLALDVPAEDLPSREEALLRYRASPAYGLAVWLGTASSANYQKHDICANLVRRYGTAFLDLDTPAAVENLENIL